MKINRIPLSISLILLLIFEMIYFFPKSAYYLAVFMLLAVFSANYLLARKNPTGESWMKFIIAPVLFSVSFLGFSFILNNRFIIQVLYISCSYLVYYYFRSIYLFLHKPSRYNPYTIENIASYGNLINFFLFSSLVFGLQSLIDAPIWLLISSILIFSALMISQSFWAYKIESNLKTLYNMICCLVIVELAWTISYLPVRFLISGMILSLCYYVLLGLARHHLQGKLEPKVVKMYLGFGTACLLVILLTSRWF